MVEVTATIRQKKREEDAPVNKCFYHSMLSMMKNRLVCLLFTLKLWGSFPSKRRKPLLSLYVNNNWTCGLCGPKQHIIDKGQLRLSCRTWQLLQDYIIHSRNVVYKLMSGVKRKLMRKLKRTGSQRLLWLAAPGWWNPRVNSIPEAIYLSLSLLYSKWKPWGMH